MYVTNTDITFITNYQDKIEGQNNCFVVTFREKKYHLPALTGSNPPEKRTDVIMAICSRLIYLKA